MNHRQNKSCEDSESLLVKKITGELLSEEKRFLDSHLAQCAFCVAREQGLAKEWHSFDALPVPEVPGGLYESTRELILGHLRREKSLLPWAGRITMKGIWSLLAPFVAGLAMTGVSYALLHNLVDFTIHRRHILIAFFSLWGLLFAGCFWLALEGKKTNAHLLDMASSFSISITFLTLLISYLASAVDPLRWLVMSAAYGVAAGSNYLFGIGNTFVAHWGIYACLASFIGAGILGFRRGPLLSQSALLGSLVITILLFPAIYLQSSSHDHGFGILAFGALGTFIGALLGTGTGLFIRRQILAATA